LIAKTGKIFCYSCVRCDSRAPFQASQAHWNNKSNGTTFDEIFEMLVMVQYNEAQHVSVEAVVIMLFKPEAAASTDLNHRVLFTTAD
jgi:hypothetical protein